MKLINRPYIKRISFLGGECLAEQNLDEILSLIKQIRISFPDKTIGCIQDILIQKSFEDNHRVYLKKD